MLTVSASLDSQYRISFILKTKRRRPKSVRMSEAWVCKIDRAVNACLELDKKVLSCPVPRWLFLLSHQLYVTLPRSPTVLVSFYQPAQARIVWKSPQDEACLPIGGEGTNGGKWKQLF